MSKQGRSGGVRRRKLIRNIGAGSVVVLAGCSSSDNGDRGDGNGRNDTDSPTPDDGGTSAQTDVDIDFGMAVQGNPADIQFNPYAATGFDDDVAFLCFDHLAVWNFHTEEWTPLLADDWSIEGSTGTIKLSQEHTWHNGDPVVADDIVALMRLGSFFGDSYWDYLESIGATDDTTLELNFSSEVNTDIFWTSLFRNVWTFAPQNTISEYLEPLEDATTDDEKDQAIQNVTEWNYKPPIGNSLWEYDRDSTKVMVFNRFDEYPVGHQNEKINEIADGGRTTDNVNFLRREIVQNDDPHLSMANDETDGIEASSSSQEAIDSMPDYVDTYAFPYYQGTAMRMALDHKLFSNRRIRQAFGYIIDRVGAEEVTGKATQFEQYPDGIPLEEQDRWLSDIIDSFEDYSDPEKGFTILREEGYTKENDTWKKPNGEPIQITLKTPTWSFADHVPGQFVAEDLSNKGIEVNHVPQDSSAFVPDLTNGDIDLMAMYTGFPQVQHGYFHLWNEFSLASGTLGDYMSFPESFQAPMPVGDPEGSIEEVPTQELISEMPQASEERMAEIIQTLSWVTNQSLPAIQVNQRFGNAFLQHREWDYPSLDSEVMGVRWPATHSDKYGMIQAKEQ